MLVAVMLAACSKHQPPVQMMAEARAAIQAAHGLKPRSNRDSADTMEQADRALHQATIALGHRRYGEARRAAQTARDLARQVIRLTRKAKQSH